MIRVIEAQVERGVNGGPILYLPYEFFQYDVLRVIDPRDTESSEASPERRQNESPDEWAARCYLHGYGVGRRAGERFAAYRARVSGPSFVPCPHCGASGLGATALERHIERRHGCQPI